MATDTKKEQAVRKSISAPQSLWEQTEKLLQGQMPPVPLSRHIQELIARDLRQRGLLGFRHQSDNGDDGGRTEVFNGKEEPAHA